MDEDCIFCKIVKGEIPASIIYEDENTLAFLDIAPIKPGHALVLTKRHSETLLHMDDRDIALLMRSVHKCADAIKKATKAEGLNILMNNFKAAGQVIPHAHIHIIPRHKGDGLSQWPSGKYDDGEMEKIRNAILDDI